MALAAMTLSLGVVVTVAWSAGGEVPTSRNLLWNIVHTFCVPAQRLSGHPLPCAVVDLSGGEDRGFAVVNNPFERSDVLVVPTARITGIEDPQLLSPAAPNYWADAWRQRNALEARVGRSISRDRVAMAVNSAIGRSQDQLHIHVDCVTFDVRRTLMQSETRLDSAWRPVRFATVSHDYLVRKIIGQDLDEIRPFQILAAEVPGARATLAQWTLVVIGATFGDGTAGFYLLTDQAQKYDDASGAELLDHSCLLAGLPLAPRILPTGIS